MTLNCRWVRAPADGSFGSGVADSAESARLAELQAYQLLDTPSEEQFERIVDLAQTLFGTPMAAISLIDKDRQWFKARSGLGRQETAREDSFCTYTIQGHSAFVVPDASLDVRFAENPLVVGDPNIRFYAGAPLRTESGHNLGAICIISPEARDSFSETDVKKLELLASIVGNEFELRRLTRQAQERANNNLHEMCLRLKNSVDYADLLAEVQSPGVATKQLHDIARAVWQQYKEAGAVLGKSIRMLRERMPADDYRALLSDLPGFAV